MVFTVAPAGRREGRLPKPSPEREESRGFRVRLRDLLEVFANHNFNENNLPKEREY
jgi:hypothetical protein